MQREYLSYVSVACKQGMTAQEVQNLMGEVYNKSNTKQGKRVLRLFAKGIAKAKKNSLVKQQDAQKENQTQFIQEKSRQYIYK